MSKKLTQKFVLSVLDDWTDYNKLHCALDNHGMQTFYEDMAAALARLVAKKQVVETWEAPSAEYNCGRFLYKRFTPSQIENGGFFVRFADGSEDGTHYWDSASAQKVAQRDNGSVVFLTEDELLETMNQDIAAGECVTTTLYVDGKEPETVAIPEIPHGYFFNFVTKTLRKMTPEEQLADDAKYTNVKVK